jgi:hypothetical protein
MTIKNVAKRLIATFLFFLLILFINQQSYATFYPISIDIIPDKPVYSPGGNVTLTINAPYQEGRTIELSVTKGNAEQKIFQTTKPLDGNSTKIEFALPENDTSYQYLVYATVTGPAPNDSGSASAMIFTKENADEVLISDLKMSRSQADAGESIHISFKVKDGVGNVIPWANPDIGICKEDAVKPHYVLVTPNSTLSQDSDCPFFQSDFIPTFDEFNIDLVIPDGMPEGKYKLNIWANPDYSGKHGFIEGHKVFDIVVGKVSNQVSDIKSPLKQFQAGVVLEDIKCKENFQLVIKLSDRSPACVKPETRQILIKRGWAEPI